MLSNGYIPNGKTENSILCSSTKSSARKRALGAKECFVNKDTAPVPIASFSVDTKAVESLPNLSGNVGGNVEAHKIREKLLRSEFSIPSKEMLCSINAVYSSAAKSNIAVHQEICCSDELESAEGNDPMVILPDAFLGSCSEPPQKEMLYNVFSFQKHPNSSNYHYLRTDAKYADLSLNNSVGYKVHMEKLDAVEYSVNKSVTFPDINCDSTYSSVTINQLPLPGSTCESFDDLSNSSKALPEAISRNDNDFSTPSKDMLYNICNTVKHLGDSNYNVLTGKTDNTFSPNSMHCTSLTDLSSAENQVFIPRSAVSDNLDIDTYIMGKSKEVYKSVVKSIKNDHKMSTVLPSSDNFDVNSIPSKEMLRNIFNTVEHLELLNSPLNNESSSAAHNSINCNASTDILHSTEFYTNKIGGDWSVTSTSLRNEVEKDNIHSECLLTSAHDSKNPEALPVVELNDFLDSNCISKEMLLNAIIMAKLLDQSSNSNSTLNTNIALQSSVNSSISNSLDSAQYSINGNSSSTAVNHNALTDENTVEISKRLNHESVLSIERCNKATSLRNDPYLRSLSKEMLLNIIDMANMKVNSNGSDSSISVCTVERKKEETDLSFCSPIQGQLSALNPYISLQNVHSGEQPTDKSSVFSNKILEVATKKEQCHPSSHLERFVFSEGAIEKYCNPFHSKMLASVKSPSFGEKSELLIVRQSNEVQSVLTKDHDYVDHCYTSPHSVEAVNCRNMSNLPQKNCSKQSAPMTGCVNSSEQSSSMINMSNVEKNISSVMRNNALTSKSSISRSTQNVGTSDVLSATTAIEKEIILNTSLKSVHLFNNLIDSAEESEEPCAKKMNLCVYDKDMTTDKQEISYDSLNKILDLVAENKTKISFDFSQSNLQTSLNPVAVCDPYFISESVSPSFSIPDVIASTTKLPLNLSSVHSRLRSPNCASSVSRSLKSAIGCRYVTTNEVYLIIIRWNVVWLIEQDKSKHPPPIVTRYSQVRNIYDSPKDYYNTYFPLLLLEIWQSIYASWKNISDKNYMCKSIAYEEKKNYVKIRCDTIIKSSDVDCIPKEGWIILVKFPTLENDFVDMFGYVSCAEINCSLPKYDHNHPSLKLLHHSSNDLLKKVSFTFFIVYNCGAIDHNGLISLSKLTNIKDSLKQHDALLNIKKSQLCQTVLNPAASNVHKIILPSCNSLNKLTACIRRGLEGMNDSEPQLMLVDISVTHNYVQAVAILIDKIKKSPASKILVCVKNENFLTLLGNSLSTSYKLVIIGSQMKVPKLFQKFSVESLGSESRELIRNCDIILCDYRDIPMLPNVKLTCCIIDEANTCTELECGLPLLCNVNKLVLVGNPNIPCEPQSKVAVSYGYDKSLIHRIFQRN